MNLNILKTLTAVFAVALLTSCDKDYLTIGGDIIGGENFEIETEEVVGGVKVYDVATNAIQTDNLATNQLGILNNGIFGTTRASVVTQLSLGTVNPAFDASAAIDSVVLTIPYNSTRISTLASGKGKYRLNDIYTDNPNDTIYNTFNLKVFRNGYNLSNFDTQDPTKNAKYYSNQKNNFDNSKIGDFLNDYPSTSQNTNFKIESKEYVKYKVDPATNLMLEKKPENIESRNSPRMRLKLNNIHFFNTILKASSENLASNTAFKNYYRGLYFQVDEGATSGSLMKLDFSKGDVTIYYKQLKTKDKPEDGKEMKSIVLNMTSNTVNVFSDSHTGDYPTAVSTYNSTIGESKIYLKGGQGSMAFVELDGGKLVNYKNKSNLINDAYLEFTVDNGDANNNIKESYLPLRLYLFDADNNLSLRDYVVDVTVNAEGDTRKNKFIHGGILYTENGLKKYKIRITEHLNRYLRDTSGDVKNVRFGLVITDNISTSFESLGGSRTVFNPFLVDYPGNSEKKLESIPTGAVLSPLGVALFGNILQGQANYDKSVKLIISYTKPK